MGLLATLAAHAGLLVFSALAVVLIGYLAYSMVHPDAF
jgi:hypothetical protein